MATEANMSRYDRCFTPEAYARDTELRGVFPVTFQGTRLIVKRNDTEREYQVSVEIEGGWISRSEATVGFSGKPFDSHVQNRANSPMVESLSHVVGGFKRAIPGLLEAIQDADPVTTAPAPERFPSFEGMSPEEAENWGQEHAPSSSYPDSLG